MNRVAHRSIRAAAASLLAASVFPGPVPAGVTVRDCGWLEMTSIPGVSISTDTNTLIYQAVYSAGPAHETVIRGRPPQARFWAFAILDQARREVANLSDFEIELEEDGSYEVVVRFGCGGAKNCIDLRAAPAPVLPDRLWYRMYVPDVDARGGVELPELEYRTIAGEPAVSAGVDEVVDCTALGQELTAPLRPGGSIHTFLAMPGSNAGPVCEPAAPPRVRRYEGTIDGQTDDLEQAGAPAEVIEVLRSVQGQGDFGATRDNAYVIIDHRVADGDLIVRAKAPTYRKQHATEKNDRAVADGSEQVRYWSLCTTMLTRPVDCLRDEDVELDTNGYFEVIVSPTCPVAGYANCLRTGRSNTGSVFYRNTLPSEDFYNEHGPAQCPNYESVFCGEYEPQAFYVPRNCPNP